MKFCHPVLHASLLILGYVCLCKVRRHMFRMSIESNNVFDSLFLHLLLLLLKKKVYGHNFDMFSNRKDNRNTCCHRTLFYNIHTYLIHTHLVKEGFQTCHYIKWNTLNTQVYFAEPTRNYILRMSAKSDKILKCIWIQFNHNLIPFLYSNSTVICTFR